MLDRVHRLRETSRWDQRRSPGVLVTFIETIYQVVGRIALEGESNPLQELEL